MKFLSVITLAAAAQAHAIFQKVSVNGVDQGQLKGVRAPSSNYPTYSVSDSNFACNSNLQYKDNTVITIPQGAKVGAWYGHVIGGPQGANDVENPIASSHKGPIQVYLAKVSDAASTGTTGLSWFKVASEGLNNGKWAVDNMIAGQGWWYFTMPSCVTAGQYLMRVELLALHSAGTSMGAQFYMECAQIQVTGSGSSSPSTVSFPGAYQQNDKGILLSIYGSNGSPDNGGRAYYPPGPDVISCAGGNTGGGGNGGGAGTTTLATTTRAATTTKATTTAPAATTTAASGGGGGGACAALYAQCGGSSWTGATCCSSGTCKASNQYYSQCVS